MQISTIRLTVPFHDLDPMQIVWHGNYLKYFDMARFSLFEKAGVDLYAYYLENGCFFPVVRSRTKYIAPLQYKDEFTCEAVVVAAQIKIVIDFAIRTVTSNVLCARGQSEQVAVRMPQRETLFEIPEAIREALCRPQ